MTGYTSVQSANRYYERKETYSRAAAISRRKALSRKRTRMVAKMRVILLSFAVMVLCMAVLSGFSRPQPSDYGMSRYYTTVRVDNGDRLWNIAEEYYTLQEGDLRSYVRQIETFNGVSAESIRPGQLLVIPYLVKSAG